MSYFNFLELPSVSETPIATPKSVHPFARNTMAPEKPMRNRALTYSSEDNNSTINNPCSYTSDSFMSQSLSGGKFEMEGLSKTQTDILQEAKNELKYVRFSFVVLNFWVEGLHLILDLLYYPQHEW